MEPRAPISSRPVVLRIAAWIAMAQIASASLAAGSALDRIDDALARGQLGYSEAARQRLGYLFDRAHMAPAWRATDEPPAKCGTRILDQLAHNRERLDPETRQRLDAILAGAQAPGTSSYTTAHFKIEYATSGPDAPVATDVAPANGIPDFVEKTGAACEQAWTVEVGQLGYTAPAIANGQNARYPVSYQAQDSYGYTIVVSGQQTRMVLHPSYAGFPFNDDPEGDVTGALRVTVAHEFKHAIQRMYSPWTEGQWLELDATWIEDVVFDQVNDYLNFIRGPGSPFTAPQQSLIPGGGGSYEDCNWETYQAETLGNDHLRHFWERRRLFPGEPVDFTYEQNFIASGTDFTHAWGEYVAWNFASGEHAALGFGYEEAATYPTTPATFFNDALPVPPISWPVNGSAASAHLISNPDATLGGTPEFTFTGAPGNPWQVSILVRHRAGGISSIPMALSVGAATVLLTGLDWADIEWAALVVGNPTPINPAISYTFSARAIAPVLISHARLWDRAEGPAPTVVRALVSSGASSLDPSTVSLTYRLNGGAPLVAAMTPTGLPDEYGASLAPQAAGAKVEYRIEARSVGGALAGSPSIPGAYHAFEVMNVFEPFETDGAWTVGDSGDDAVTGGWERAIPRGTVSAPYLDATSPPGDACFVTQNGSIGGLAGEADVDQGKTTLRSPVFGFYTGGPFARAEVRYRRWYSNHVGGRPDDVWRVDASNDGGVSWSSVENVALGENAWVPVTVDLLALFGVAPAHLQFRFVAEDIGASSLVEAAVDDFEILAVPQNPVAVPNEFVAGVALGSPLPNPSRGAVRVRLSLPRAVEVAASLRDLQGRLVQRLLAPYARRPAGVSWIVWDGGSSSGGEAPAGLYWLEVRAGAEVLRRKLVRLGGSP